MDRAIFNRNIRIRLAVLNKTRADVAKAMGTTWRTVEKKLHGKVTTRQIAFFSRALGVGTEVLCDHDPRTIVMAPHKSPMTKE